MTLGEKLEEWSIPEPTSGCWLWLGTLVKGYGTMRWMGGNYRAPRLAWEAFRGPIPSGMYVCHRCDNRACINPDHLFLGTPRANVLDMMNKGRAVFLSGEANGWSRLATEDVMAVLRDPRPARNIAAAYGIGKTTVTDIKRGNRWGSTTGAARPK